MVIFSDSTGQLGNQLFEFGTFIANAIENNSKLYNPCFAKYSEFFSGSSGQLKGLRIYTTFGKFQDKLVRNISQNDSVVALIKSVGLLLQNNLTPYDINNFNSKGKVFLKKGSWYIDFKNFYKHQDEIRAYFTPVASHRKVISDFMGEIRKKYNIVVGVHIRRGDYKDFHNGQFYFEDDVYNEKLNQIKALFPEEEIVLTTKYWTLFLIFTLGTIIRLL